IPALGDNLNALVKYNISEGNSECISGGGVISDANEIIDEREQCPNVDVLILYTQAALNAYPDIISRAYLAFSNTVTALTNSVVPKSRLNPNLVGVQLVSGFEPTGMWGADTTTIIGANSAVRMLRNAYNADLVLIMVPEVYTFFSGAVINFGDSEADGNNHAFAVVETGFANAPTYTFAHEFAHLFGCRHQLDTDCYLNHDNSGLSDAHAHNWGKGFHLGLLNFQRYYRTIVNACNYGQYAKILYYSNPGVEFNGKETGVAGESNNAKILRNAACRIANYRESHAINVNIINGPIPFTCPGYSISLTGTAFGGFGPYQFYWKYRLGNGAWIDYNPNNSQSTFNYTIPGNFYGMIYVELTVTNGTDYATSSTWAYSDYLKCPHYRPSSNERDEKEPEGFPADFQIIPNPAINNIQIQLDTPIKQDIEVVVTNLTGEVCILKTLNKNGQDIQNFQIDVAKLPAGLYLIRLNQSGTSGRVHKLAITGK
ncbi:MAG: T9SS type A sorting domain-containing protein, partial [Bacteroidetes bacterium]|nr:T9SS type A sorting domain-containing protein [Bacteroidota bacterium]